MIRASIIFTHYRRTDSRELAVVLHVLSFLFPCLFVPGNVTAGDWPQQPAATYGGLRQQEWALLQLLLRHHRILQQELVIVKKLRTFEQILDVWNSFYSQTLIVLII